MTPSGRCAHVVKPNGTLVHTSQYCVDGMTLIFTRMPASFHCSTIAWTASSSQPGCGRQTISVSMPLGMARLGEQTPRFRDVALEGHELRVLGTHRAHVVVLAGLAEAPVGD